MSYLAESIILPCGQLNFFLMLSFFDKNVWWSTVVLEGGLPTSPRPFVLMQNNLKWPNQMAEYRLEGDPFSEHQRSKKADGERSAILIGGDN